MLIFKFPQPTVTRILGPTPPFPDSILEFNKYKGVLYKQQIQLFQRLRQKRFDLNTFFKLFFYLVFSVNWSNSAGLMYVNMWHIWG